MTHTCPKPEKYLFPGISGCIFVPGYQVQGGPVNPHAQRVQNMYGKGGRESKMPSYGRLLISPFPTAGD